MVTCQKLFSWFNLFHGKIRLCNQLNKVLYGLKQAQRAQLDKLKTSLLQLGFNNFKLDTSLFIYKANGKFVFLLIYLNDMLVTDDDVKLIKLVIIDLTNKFPLKILGSLNNFLSFETFRNEEALYLTQSKYILNLLQNTNMITT